MNTSTFDVVRNFAQLPDEAMVNIHVVLMVTGFSRSVWYAGIKSGIYPRQTKTGKRSVRWQVGEIRKTLKDLKTS